LTQATVGLEVGQEGHKYKNEFSKQLDIIKQLKSRGVNIFTMNQFADTYKNYYPNLSPPTVVIVCIARICPCHYGAQVYPRAVRSASITARFVSGSMSPS